MSTKITAALGFPPRARLRPPSSRRAGDGLGKSIDIKARLTYVTRALEAAAFPLVREKFVSLTQLSEAARPRESSQKGLLP